MNVPEKLKKALFDKGWSQKKLCAEMGITENGLKNMIDRNSWKLETIEKMAAAMGVPVIYFLTDSEENLDYSPKPADGGAFGDKIISKVSASIDDMRRVFEEELRAKNQQIANLMESQRSLQESQRSLQDMLKMVLGKSKSVTFTQLPIEDEAFNRQYDNYRDAAVERISSMFGVPVQQALHT